MGNEKGVFFPSHHISSCTGVEGHHSMQSWCQRTTARRSPAASPSSTVPSGSTRVSEPPPSGSESTCRHCMTNQSHTSDAKSVTHRMTHYLPFSLSQLHHQIAIVEFTSHMRFWRGHTRLKSRIVAWRIRCGDVFTPVLWRRNGCTRITSPCVQIFRRLFREFSYGKRRFVKTGSGQTQQKLNEQAGCRTTPPANSSG